MMRLNPEGYQMFYQAEKFEASYAGGEANVAVSLANYGRQLFSAYCASYAKGLTPHALCR